MHKYIPRRIETAIKHGLKHFPVIAILGPRQSGKSTLAKQIIKRLKAAVYLDLELPGDLAQLDQPELFPVLRGFIDKTAQPGQMLMLESASPDLLKQSSESLAGR